MDRQTGDRRPVERAMMEVATWNQRLMKQNWRLKIASLVAVVLIVALVLTAVVLARRPKIAPAPSSGPWFRHLGAGSLSVGDERGSNIWLKADKGGSNIWLKATEGTTRLIFCGENGSHRMTLQLGSHKTSFVLRDKFEKPRAALFLDEGDSPHLEFYDENGEVIWQAPPEE
jgi:hypothetical protein